MDTTTARAIAKEAYIYGYPLVDSYRVQYDYFQDAGNPQFKAPWNHLCNVPRVYTAADTAVTTPNSDTPYSLLGLDLRSEPLVLTVPPIERGALLLHPADRRLHVRLRLHRQPHDGQRRRQLPRGRARVAG